MSRITGVIVALATTAAVLTGSTAGSAPPPAPASVPAVNELPREIEGGVELAMADGDALRIWASSDNRTVWAQRLDAATGSWGPKQEVLRRRNVYCGDVDARTSNGAVAVTARCNLGGYPDDQAPTGSYALWSADTVTWTSYELAGEAYDEPGLSPDGSRAVWPEFRGYVTWGPEGFVRRAFETPGQEYTATATITDDAQVSYLYGAPVSPRRCGLVVLTRTGDAAPTRQEVALDSACQDVNFANVDSHSAVFGEFAYPASVSVVSRSDASAPWSVTQGPPEDAPGLVAVERRTSGPGLPTEFFTAPGGPLVALASRTGRRVRAQLYDPVAQVWGATVTVHESRTRCRWGPDTVLPLAVIAPVVTCGGSDVVLTTRDGVAWQALRMGRRSLGQSPDARYVAVPGPAGTHVISPVLGVVTLPRGTTGRCDIAVPDGPRAAVQYVSGGGPRRWPTILRRVSSDGTDRLGRFPARVRGRCAAYESGYERATDFDMESTRAGRGQTVRIVRRGDGWTVRTSRWRVP